MYLHTLGATLVEDRLYFVSCDFNALFCMDLKEKRIEYKTYFAAYAKYRRELYAKQILFKNRIYFIPRTCNKIAIYDIETEKTTYIEIGEKREDTIRDAFIEGNYLWMLYSRYPGNIFKVNLLTNKYEVINIDWNTIFEKIDCTEQIMSDVDIGGAKAKQVGKYWWMIASKHGYILNYDWKRNKIRVHSLPYFKDKMIAGDIQEKVWIMARNENKVLEYDFENRAEKWLQIQEISQIPGDITGIIEQDDYIFFIKCKGMVVMSKKTHEARLFRFSSDRNVNSYAIYDEKMILLPAQGKGLAVFRFSDSMIEEYTFEWEEKLTNESFKRYFSSFLSEDICELQEFIKLSSEKRKDCDQNRGSVIWNTLCKR